uniref:B30.2/SPRY domain-containing protein n=1 Tax=Pelusios castaneus TaxID=367368 RepID=A0A8C8RGX7_9SAUR
MPAWVCDGPCTRAAEREQSLTPLCPSMPPLPFAPGSVPFLSPGAPTAPHTASWDLPLPSPPSALLVPSFPPPPLPLCLPLLSLSQQQPVPSPVPGLPPSCTPPFPRCCVLPSRSLSWAEGRYWEVDVGDKTRWTLGVCRESVKRKGEDTYTPGNGYWAVWLRDGKYEALTSSWDPLPVSVRPSRVGIFLDYEAGEVSFYNVTDGSHLYTFTDTSGTLRPYFCPGLILNN